MIGGVAGVVVHPRRSTCSSACASTIRSARSPVHGVCGIWGTLSLGLFATGQFGAPSPTGADTSAGALVTGLFYGGGVDQLDRPAHRQRRGHGGDARRAGFALMYAVKATGTLRVSREGELEGLDIHEHGGPAYPELIGSMGMHGAGASEAHAMKAQAVPAKAF